MSISFPSHIRSMTCPPIIPSTPTPLLKTEISITALCADILPSSAALEITSKARVFRASPARSAMLSGKALWQEGFPLLKSSLSIHGRSSCIREKVWISSKAQATSRILSISFPPHIR